MEFEKMLREMTVSPALFNIAVAVFKDIWNDRHADAQQRKDSLKTEISKAQREIETYLDRIVTTQNVSVVNAYEKRIAALEDDKIVLEEKIAKCGSALPEFDETFRTSLKFLSNPHGMWVSGDLAHRRTALKLCFAENPLYDLKKGFRTTSKALPLGP